MRAALRLLSVWRFLCPAFRARPSLPRPLTVKEPAELLAYLFAAWPETKKKQIRTWLKAAAVTVNGRPVTQFDHRLRKGDVVTIEPGRSPERMTAVRLGLEIVFEDADIVVVDKPPNLLSIATDAERERTLYHLLTAYLRARSPRARERVWIVHRLDRATSGLMVFAKTVDAKRALQTGWDRAEKRYEAIVEGTMGKPAGTFDSHLDESNPSKVFSTRPSAKTRRAVTHYEVLAHGAGRSRVRLFLETGRRHQIRVHLADAGHPVIGDEKYGAAPSKAGRLALHATGLTFLHPSTRETVSFESRMPRELARLVPTSRR